MLADFIYDPNKKQKKPFEQQNYTRERIDQKLEKGGAFYVISEVKRTFDSIIFGIERTIYCRDENLKKYYENKVFFFIRSTTLTMSVLYKRVIWNIAIKKSVFPL